MPHSAPSGRPLTRSGLRPFIPLPEAEGTPAGHPASIGPLAAAEHRAGAAAAAADLVAGPLAAREGRVLQEREPEVGWLAALLRRHEGAPGVERPDPEHPGPRQLLALGRRVEVLVRFGQV